MSRIVTVKIGGEGHSINLDDVLRITNADAERHSVAADVAWWGVIAAAAASQVERLAAAAASWHAKALVKCLQTDDKIAEWKAKATANSHDEYLELLQAVADAKEESEKANNIHWSLIRKSDMLREMIRGESGDQRASRDIGRPAGPAMTDPVPLDPKDRLAGFRQRQRRQDKED